MCSPHDTQNLEVAELGWTPHVWHTTGLEPELRDAAPVGVASLAMLRSAYDPASRVASVPWRFERRKNFSHTRPRTAANTTAPPTLPPTKITIRAGAVVGNAVGVAVGVAVGDAVGGSVGDAVGGSVGTAAGDAGCGHDPIAHVYSSRHCANDVLPCPPFVPGLVGAQILE